MSDYKLGRVLVTGASGFVGRALVHELLQRGFAVTAAVRRLVTLPAEARVVEIMDLAAAQNWDAAFDDVRAVVHCAARVHVMRDRAHDPVAAYRGVNVDGSLALARAAAERGVQRFVFLSSIKAVGEWTAPGHPLRAADVPAPVDPYGISKFEAERALATLAAEAGLELVVLRPPLVYGPGVRANFLAMATWLARGVPLPLGGITANRRSFVALDNLLDLIVRCLRHPAAPGGTFHVSDGEDLSTTELLRRTAAAMGRPARLVPVPARWLARGAQLVGRPDLWQRLGGTLQVDIQDTLKRLGWHPPISVDEGLRRAVRKLVRRDGTAR